MLARRLILPALLLSSLALGCQAPSHFKPNDPPTLHGPACPAIDSTRSIGFSGDRAEALIRIASRTGLSQHEQTALLDAATQDSMFSADRAKVLIAIIQNPQTTQESLNDLAPRLPSLGLFSDDQARITSALTDAASRARSN